MTTLIVLYGLIVLAGMAAGISVNVSDRRRRPDGIPREVLARLDQQDTALLTGGVARAIDASVVGLAERGHVVADGGRLTVTPHVDAMLDTSMDSPEYRADWDRNEAMLLVSVRRAGRQGLDAVRRDAVKLILRGRFERLVRHGLIIGPRRRQWGPMVITGPVLVGLFCVTMAMLGTGPMAEVEIPMSIMIGLWLPSAVLTAFVWSRRPGYHGPDPRSADGRAVSEALGAELGADTSQQRRVTVGGFATMTDDALRRAVQGRAADSRWNVRTGRGYRRSGGEINAALAAGTGLSVGGGGDGGDFGGGGE